MKIKIRSDRDKQLDSHPVSLRGLKLLAAISTIVLISFAGCHPVGQLGGGFKSKLFGFHGTTKEITVAPPSVKKFSSYVSSRFDQEPPKRVAIIQTNQGLGRYDAAAKFVDALAAECRLAGVFEVIQPQYLQCRSKVDEILRGRFDEREIASIARTYHCDAIMFVRFNQFQGHWPLSAGVTAVMVDTNESVVTFSVDGSWDTSDPDILKSYKAFVYGKTKDIPEEACLIYLQSPANLFNYISRQMTEVMKSAPRTR